MTQIETGYFVPKINRKLVSSIYNKELLYILDTIFFSFSLFSRQFKRHCPLIWARNDHKTHQKKKKKKEKLKAYLLSWSEFL